PDSITMSLISGPASPAPSPSSSRLPPVSAQLPPGWASPASRAPSRTPGLVKLLRPYWAEVGGTEVVPPAGATVVAPAGPGGMVVAPLVAGAGAIVVATEATVVEMAAPSAVVTAAGAV